MENEKNTESSSGIVGMQGKKIIIVCVLALLAVVVLVIGIIMKINNQGEKAVETTVAPKEVQKDGDAYLVDGDFAKAADFYKDALKKEPNNSYYLQKLALSDAAVMQYDYKSELSIEALDAINKAIKLDLNNSENYRIKGYIQEVSFDFKSAAESYSKAVELDSKNQAAYMGLGHCYAALDNSQKASESYSKAYELTPNDGFTNLSYANQVFIRNNKFEEAIPYLEKAINNLTDKRLKAEALTVRGEVAAQQGKNISEIVSFFNQAIQTDDSYSRAYVGKAKNVFLDALNTQAQTQNADTANASIQQSLDLLQKANEINTQDASARYWQGLILHLGGRNELALTALVDALDRVGKDVTLLTPYDRNTLMGSIYYEMAGVQSSAGQTDNAVINLKKALILNPSLGVNLAKAYEMPVYFKSIKNKKAEIDEVLKSSPLQ